MLQFLIITLLPLSRSRRNKTVKLEDKLDPQAAFRLTELLREFTARKKRQPLMARLAEENAQDQAEIEFCEEQIAVLLTKDEEARKKAMLVVTGGAGGGGRGAGSNNGGGASYLSQEYAWAEEEEDDNNISSATSSVVEQSSSSSLEVVAVEIVPATASAPAPTVHLELRATAAAAELTPVTPNADLPHNSSSSLTPSEGTNLEETQVSEFFEPAASLDFSSPFHNENEDEAEIEKAKAEVEVAELRANSDDDDLLKLELELEELTGTKTVPEILNKEVGIGTDDISATKKAETVAEPAEVEQLGVEAHLELEQAAVAVAVAVPPEAGAENLLDFERMLAELGELCVANDNQSTLLPVPALLYSQQMKELEPELEQSEPRPTSSSAVPPLSPPPLTNQSSHPQPVPQLHHQKEDEDELAQLIRDLDMM